MQIQLKLGCIVSDLDVFWQRLRRGPAILFLGQNYLQVETGEDPLLKQIESRFGGERRERSYDQLFEGSAHRNGDNALAWMSERCRGLSAPSWLRSVSEFSWSGVVSSAIDPVWLSAFRNDWRDVAPIYDNDYFPRNPRNRRELHCTFLFGSLNQTEPTQRPPLTKFEHLARMQAARNLFDRLPDVMTPLGVLAIEAYDPDRDWMTLADLIPTLQTLGSDQVHFFSVKSYWLDDPLLSELINMGKVTTHSESLSSALEKASARGLIKFGPQSEWASGARSIDLGDYSISIPRELWNRVNKFGTILDDRVLSPPQQISDEALYWEFRRFLFECGVRPLWSGFARGLAFHREFEDLLWEVTTNRLKRGTFNNHPVVVHGQTGTGKTVALGALAYRLAASRAYPTIYIERRAQRPNYADIDLYCQWLEDHGSDATLIVWDGMLASSDYYDLQSYLASRGRKAVVVGSSYKLEESAPNLVEVPDRLTSTEAPQFLAFLEQLGVDVTRHHRDALESRDPSYLVALYRFLPPARPQIRTGVVEELERLEANLVASVEASTKKSQPLTALAEALLSAGIIDSSRLEMLQEQSSARFSSNEIVDLVDIVTVPGRFGLNIPIELLARTCGNTEFSNLAQMLRGVDLINALEDEAGRIAVGPRHRLEAELIVQSRIGDVHAEASIVSRIIRALNPSTWPDENDEMEFVISLLQEVGPRGDERPRFAPTFRDLSEAIADLREARNIKNPRLMLQEAYLLREWVTIQSRFGSRPEDTREILEDAQSILEEALELLGDSNGHRRLKTIIATELASNYGTITVDSIMEPNTKQEDVKRDFQRLLDAVGSARELDSSAYNPVDVLAWTSWALAGSGTLDEFTRTEAIVDVIDALKTVDQDLLETHNVERLGVRRYEAFTLLGNENLSESAFQDLVAMGSASGYYIRALEISGARARDLDDDELDPLRVERAWKYLEEHRADISNDARCLNLLFDYWWITKMGQRLFASERLTLPMNGQEWLYGLHLINDIRAKGTYRDLTLSFLEAVGLFHVNRTSQSLQSFREVESRAESLRGRRRIQKFFLASETGGAAQTFHGNVRWVHQEGRRGEVFVEELSRPIRFIPRDFSRPDIRRGEPLGEFHIGFSFIGPIADPRIRSGI